MTGGFRDRAEKGREYQMLLHLYICPIGGDRTAFESMMQLYNQLPISRLDWCLSEEERLFTFFIDGDIKRRKTSLSLLKHTVNSIQRSVLLNLEELSNFLNKYIIVNSVTIRSAELVNRFSIGLLHIPLWVKVCVFTSNDYKYGQFGCRPFTSTGRGMNNSQSALLSAYTLPIVNNWIFILENLMCWIELRRFFTNYLVIKN